MRVIGVAGQNGSGKDEVINHLNSRYHVPSLSTGDIVREIASREGLEPTRTNLQDISERYFHEFGEGHFIRLIADRIRKNGWEIAGITGIRSPEDIAELKNAFEKDFVLIYVNVRDPYVRYTRSRKRGEERDPDSYERFIRQDKAEEELFHIKDAALLADYSLNNDGPLDDLHRALDNLISEKGLLPAAENPSK